MPQIPGKFCLKPSLDPKFCMGLTYKVFYSAIDYHYGLFKKHGKDTADTILFITLLNNNWELVTLPVFNLLFVPNGKEEDFKKFYENLVQNQKPQQTEGTF